MDRAFLLDGARCSFMFGPHSVATGKRKFDLVFSGFALDPRTFWRAVGLVSIFIHARYTRYGPLHVQDLNFKCVLHRLGSVTLGVFVPSFWIV